MANEANDPIKNKKEITSNPDPKIDQDFKGYPHGPASDATIQPGNNTEEKTANLDHTDGEKKIIPKGQRASLDEQDSDGSANAFDDK